MIARRGRDLGFPARWAWLVLILGPQWSPALQKPGCTISPGRLHGSHPTGPTACGLRPWLFCPHCPLRSPLALLLDEDHPPGGGQPGPCAPLSLSLSGSGTPPSSSLMCVSGGLASPRCPACSEGLPSGRCCTGLLVALSTPLPSFRNAVYSTRRDFASPVSRTTWMLSLRKFSKTWRKGKSPP